MVSKNYLMIRQVMQSQTVRDALKAKADAGDQVTNRVAAQKGFSVRASTTQGTRPRGRPYARIELPGGQEFGTYKEPRLRILGTVAAMLRNGGRS